MQTKDVQAKIATIALFLVVDNHQRKGYNKREQGGRIKAGQPTYRLMTPTLWLGAVSFFYASDYSSYVSNRFWQRNNQAGCGHQKTHEYDNGIQIHKNPLPPFFRQLLDRRMDF